MKVFIDKSFFGSKKNLVLEKDSFSWVEDNQSNFDLKLDLSSKNSLNKFLKIYDKEPISLIDKSYLKIAETLGIKEPNWKFLLPEKEFLKKSKSFHSNLLEVQSMIESESYSKSFSLGNPILRKFSKIKPDRELIRNFLSRENNPTLKSIVSSFIPKEGDFCEKITYDRLKTVTGRLVVRSGPQVLLLPREMKKVFKSRYGKEGKIYWVDFVSLEPRFTKLLTSKNSKIDIYTDILKQSNISCSREQVKLAVLSTLFGAGLSKISEIVGEEAFVVKRLINDYFKLDKVLEMTGNFSSGKIRNYFGRPITLKKSSSNVALNNYVQSSSVDISLIGFSKLSENYSFLSSVKALCVIHDALVLDVKKDEAEALEEIINKGIDITDVGHFYLGFESYESNC